MVDVPDEYPEHQKLVALGGKNEVVGDFLTWLSEVGYKICRYESGRYLPLSYRIEGMLADYFGIDQKGLEREKREMLALFRKAKLPGQPVVEITEKPGC